MSAIPKNCCMENMCIFCFFLLFVHYFSLRAGQIKFSDKDDVFVLQCVRKEWTNSGLPCYKRSNMQTNSTRKVQCNIPHHSAANVSSCKVCPLGYSSGELREAATQMKSAYFLSFSASKQAFHQPLKFSQTFFRTITQIFSISLGTVTFLFFPIYGTMLLLLILEFEY